MQLNHRLKSLLLFVFAFFIAAGCRDLSRGGASASIQHFSGFCHASMGPWTRQALHQTNSMIAVLDEIKSFQIRECDGLNGVIDELQQLRSYLQQLNNDPMVNTYRTAEQVKVDILRRLSTEVDYQTPELTLALQHELYQQELVALHAFASAEVSRNNRSRTNFVDGLSSVNQMLVNILNRGQLNACFQALPQAPLVLSAGLLGIAGRYTTPLLGGALAEIGQLMASSILLLKNLRIDQSRLRFENIQMQSAIGCALESMAELYCEADHTEKIIKEAIKASVEPSPVVDGKFNVWFGIRLLGRHYRAFNSWLNRLTSALEPYDRYVAERINAVWSRYEKLRAIHTTTTGLAKETERELLQYSDPSEVDLVAKKGFKRIFKILFPNNAFMPGTQLDNPVAEIFGDRVAICRLAGKAPDCIPESAAGFDLSQWIDVLDIVGGWPGFQRRLSEMLSEVKNIVDRQLLETVNQDPDRLVAEAVSGTLAHWSPLQFMKKTVQFLDEYLKTLAQQSPNAIDTRLISLVEDTRDRFVRVVNDIESPLDPSRTVAQAFTQFKLIEGTQFIQQRLFQIIQWEIERRIKLGDLNPSVLEDLISAGQTLLQFLEAMRVDINRDADFLMMDLRNAKFISRQNLLESVQFFAPTLNKLLKQIRKSKEFFGERSPLDPAHQRLAHLCFMVLMSTPNWPKNIDIKLCHGTQLQSAYSAELVLNFDEVYQKLAERKLMDPGRACLFSDFLRDSRLYRILNKNHSHPHNSNFILPSVFNLSF